MKTYTELAISVPDTLAPVKEDIRRFIDAMIYKLDTNSHKGRWEDMRLEDALKKLCDEVHELVEATSTKNNMVEILLESADVANFAMIAAAIAIERGR